MATKVVKKKKSAASPARKKTTRVRTRKTATAKAHVKRPRVSMTDLVRSAKRSKPSEVTAYYAIGLLALGIAGFVLTYHGVRNWNSTENRNPAQETLVPVKSAPPALPNQSRTVNENVPLIEEFRSASTMSSGDKIVYWSNFLEKNRHGRDLLVGLGAKFSIEDSAPLFPNEYNCTTYVETVAALARSQSIDDLVSNLLAIRYKEGKSGFFNRNHFPEADWIPNNQKSLILDDITSQVASASGVTVQVEQKTIDKRKWFQSHEAGRKLKERELASTLPPDWLEPKSVSLNYIPIADLKQVLDHIPNGAVLNLVHQGDQHHPVLITHQGFVIRANDRVYVRHASIGGRIRTNDLGLYIQSLTKHRANARWPLVGINLNQINPSTSANSLRKEAM